MAGVEQSWSKSFLSARLPFLGSLATKGIYMCVCVCVCIYIYIYFFFFFFFWSTPVVVFLLLASLDPSLDIWGKKKTQETLHSVVPWVLRFLARLPSPHISESLYVNLYIKFRSIGKITSTPSSWKQKSASINILIYIVFTLYFIMGSWFQLSNWQHIILHFTFLPENISDAKHSAPQLPSMLGSKKPY